MPRKPPAEPIDHHYNIPKLNRVFFVAGAILTVTFVWMVLADYSRDWKSIQRTFLRLDRDKTLEAQKAAREKAYGAERDRLRQSLASSQEEIRVHSRSPGEVEPAPRGPRSQDLRRRSERQVREGILRRRSLHLRRRPGQPSQVGAEIQARARPHREELERREPASRSVEEGRGRHSGGDRSDYGPPRRGPTFDRQALGRLQVGAPESRQPASGHDLHAAKLADPGHGEPLLARPAGAAARSLQRRELHEDPACRSVRDLSHGRGQKRIRGSVAQGADRQVRVFEARRRQPGRLLDSPPPEPDGGERISPSLHRFRVHSLPRRARPCFLFLVRGSLSRDGQGGKALGAQVRLGVRQVQRDADSADEIRGGRVLSVPRGRGELPGSAEVERRHEARRRPGLLGLSSHRGSREAESSQSRAFSRTGRGQGLERVGDPLGDESRLLPSEYEDAVVLLPGEFRRGFGRSQADEGPGRDESAWTSRKRRDGQLGRRVPLREIPTRPGLARPRARGRRARAKTRGRSRLLRLPRDRSAPGRASGPGRHVPPVRPESGRHRLEGLARLDFPVDLGSEEVEPGDEDAESPSHPAGCD